MGLGKTIQAIGVINADPTIQKILVACPASLKRNWQRELQKWLTRPFKIAISEGKRCWPEYFDITIINYDILQRHADKLRAQNWDMIILDEVHYLKNPDAKRTVAIFGHSAKKRNGQIIEEAVPPMMARRRLALSGTPIPNRTIEGFGLFHYLAPKEFPSKYAYENRYCAASSNGFGRDASGASNLIELQQKLRSTFMVRRLKKDVLTELPPKRRSVIEVEGSEADESVVKNELKEWEARKERIAALQAAVELAKASDDPAEHKRAMEGLREAESVAFEEMARVRKETAIRKIPYVIEHIRDVLDSEQKLVVFVHHHELTDAILRAFNMDAKQFAGHGKPTAVHIDGRTEPAIRQTIVDHFQQEDSCRLFIGGIQAAGVGLTLTAASHVVFGELDWVPGNMTQAEDRCHRIGQRDMVLVEHIVLAGSLDARMANVIVAKQEVLEQALDTNVPMRAPRIQQQADTTASERETPESIAKQAISVKPEAMTAILEGLRILAGMDGDHARTENGIGFSQADTFIGHSLAQRPVLSPKQAVLGSKLVNRYRRQLPESIVEAARI